MQFRLKGTPPVGILLIDKPTGITSHDVIYQVRKKTGVKRVGHAGTLDPLATGLLIVLVGREFTKTQDGYMKLDKEYLCKAKLGMTTDTYDIDGQITDQQLWPRLVKLAKSSLEKILENFRGEITQTVPAYSAVKVRGEKLYHKARQGKINLADLPQRKIEIKQLELLKFEKDIRAEEAFFTIKINCSSGTYVRSLVHDIGQLLGVGATVITLRRTKIGEYDVEQAETLESFKA